MKSVNVFFDLCIGRVYIFGKLPHDVTMTSSTINMGYILRDFLPKLLFYKSILLRENNLGFPKITRKLSLPFFLRVQNTMEVMHYNFKGEN